MYICLLLIRHGLDVPLIHFSVDGYRVFSTMIKKKKKKKNTTLSEQFHNHISKSQKETNSILITHNYMIAHFPDLLQALQ